MTRVFRDRQAKLRAAAHTHTIDALFVTPSPTSPTPPTSPWAEASG
jgi:hypothetical protein